MAKWLDYFKTHNIDLIVAISIAVFGCLLILLIKKTLVNLVQKKSQEKTAKLFIINLFCTFLLIIVIIMVLNKLGVPTGSLIAVLGASSLAIALALQNSLSNVAAGIILIFIKPFKITDSVIIDNTAGTVDEINLFNTCLKTTDNEKIYFPNSKIISDKISNKTSESTRRLVLSFWLEHNTNVAMARAITLPLLNQDRRVLTTPTASIVVSDITTNGLALNVQVWVCNTDFSTLKVELLENIQTLFINNNIHFSTNNNI